MDDNDLGLANSVDGNGSNISDEIEFEVFVQGRIDRS